MIRSVILPFLCFLLNSCGQPEEINIQKSAEMSFRYSALLQQSGMTSGQCSSEVIRSNHHTILVCVINRASATLYLLALETSTSLRLTVARSDEKMFLLDTDDEIREILERAQGMTIECDTFLKCQEVLLRKLPTLLQTI